MNDPRPAIASAILGWRGSLTDFVGTAAYAAYAGTLKAWPRYGMSPAEAEACARALADHGQAQASFPAVLVRLMYEPAFRIGATVDYAALGELGIALLRAAIGRPRLFLREGDAEAYTRFLEAVTTRILETARRDPGHQAVQTFLNESHFIDACFSQSDLRPLFEKRAAIARLHLAGFATRPDLPPAERRAAGRTRIGILCNHFAAHPETFVTMPLFRHLDRSRFEIHLLSQLPFDVDAHAVAVAQLAEHAIVLPGSLADKLAAVRKLDLDVLCVGTNVTAGMNASFLLALHRLARIQIAGCCSPATTGISGIDYFLSGDLAETSPDPQRLYTEKLIRLRGTGMCFDTSLDSVPPLRLDRTALGIPGDATVFASGANMNKIGPELRKAWARILAGTPGSVLVTYPYGSTWDLTYPRAVFESAMRAALAAESVDEARVIFLDPLKSRAKVKAVLAHADIYLDSFPYGGANTIVDALEQGIPSIAMRGGFQRSQQGAAILEDLGMDDLVARDLDDYCRLAIALGTGSVIREDISERIADRMRAKPRFLDSVDYAGQFGELVSELVGRIGFGSAP
jgi:predicted O-linked N-acetylglucosamine transferase (SPINDLY family)